MEKIKIKTKSINLDQLLKWSNVVGSGGEAKYLINTGLVLLNGSVQNQRSKKVFPGDVVEIKDNITMQVESDVD